MFRLPVLVKDILVLPLVLWRSMSQVKLWCGKIITLSTIAKIHPHSAYAAFVHGVLHKLNYVIRTVDLVGSLFQPLEDAIHKHFIPALTAWPPCSELER